MLTTDLGACEWFVWDLRRSNLIDRGQLDQLVGEFLQKNPGAEPPALAEFLVKKGVLTEFQAERLLQGKTQGFVLGPFVLMDSLGTGSMGTVYKAQSKNDSRWYAVKVLPRRSMWNVRIARRKVRLFEQCQHPAVVPFVDVGTSGGMHYLAWPLVEGETLEKVVQREGRLSAEVAAGLAIQAAEGLHVCHQQKLFHGLLKPSNLMLGPDGQVRILDFGIGCLLAETEGESLVDTMSTANAVNSGLDCASPESIMDPTNLTPLGDQYSLGCVLYHALSGRYPFPDGTAVEKMMCHQHKQPTPLKELNPEVPDALVAVVERLMQKEPGARYPGCAELIEALRPIANPGGGSAPARRSTMVMPRAKLPPRPAAAEKAIPVAKPAAKPAPAPDARPLRQPEPVRPSAQGTRPSAQGTRPSAQGTRASNQGTRPPAAAPHAPNRQIAVPPSKLAREPEEPAPRRSGVGVLTIALLALVAGVAAFFLSKMIPF
jgi:serine/threonine protein kinase